MIYMKYDVSQRVHEKTAQSDKLIWGALLYSSRFCSYDPSFLNTLRCKIIRLLVFLKEEMKRQLFVVN